MVGIKEESTIRAISIQVDICFLAFYYYIKVGFLISTHYFNNLPLNVYITIKHDLLDLDNYSQQSCKPRSLGCYSWIIPLNNHSYTSVHKRLWYRWLNRSCNSVSDIYELINFYNTSMQPFLFYFSLCKVFSPILLSITSSRIQAISERWNDAINNHWEFKLTNTDTEHKPGEQLRLDDTTYQGRLNTSKATRFKLNEPELPLETQKAPSVVWTQHIGLQYPYPISILGQKVNKQYNILSWAMNPLEGADPIPQLGQDPNTSWSEIRQYRFGIDFPCCNHVLILFQKISNVCEKINVSHLHG